MTRLATTDNGSDVRRATLAGLVANLLLAALKFVVGALTRSQALVADAAHSASDLATDVAILAGSHSGMPRPMPTIPMAIVASKPWSP